MNSLSGTQKLLDVMARLRAPDGCPWDKEQTHESIASCAIEEAHELLEAIVSKDESLVREELGDVLLQVVFHSQLASERCTYTFDDVASQMAEKLIHRHPHVFASAEADTSEDVKVLWEGIKQKEKGKEDRGILGGISGLPPILRAEKAQKKAGRVGFDWENWDETLIKLHEEIQELKEAKASDNETHVEEEMGDLFFTLINLSRKLKVDPSLALEKATQKFIKRFQLMEKEMALEGKAPTDLSPMQWEEKWQVAKTQLKKNG